MTYCVAKPGPTFSYKQARMYTVSFRTVLQDLITVHAFTLDSLPFPTSNHAVGVVIVVLVLERTRKRWGIPTFNFQRCDYESIQDLQKWVTKLHAIAQ